MKGLQALIFIVAALTGYWSPGSNTFLISSNYTGRATGNEQSAELAVTPDGRYVAFISYAGDLDGRDTNGTADLYLLDRNTGARRCITNPTNRMQSPVFNYFTSDPVLSENGRFVGFLSDDPTLAAITNYPTSRPRNFFIYDTALDRYFLGSPYGNATTPWPQSVYEATLSIDGKYSSFLSGGQIYRGDLGAGTAERVNVDLDGNAALISNIHAHTPDHRFFVFASGSTVSGTAKTDRTEQVYWRDMEQRVTRLVSVATNGGYADTNCFARAISPDGRYVAFRSTAANLQSGMGGWQTDDLFIRDMVANETWCVTVNSNGTASLGNSTRVQHQQFSADSRRLLFQAFLVPGPFYNFLYVHDILSRTNRALATNTWEGVVALSANGRYALYSDGAFALRSMDIDTLRTQRIGRLGVWSPPVSGLQITADGRWTFFVSHTNDVAGVTDTNSRADVFAAPTISPRIQSIAGAGVRTVEATGYPGDTLRLQRSEDLRTWSTVDSETASEHGAATLEDNAAEDSPTFYRLVSP